LFRLQSTANTMLLIRRARGDRSLAELARILETS
jgi:hypothetical protein